MRLIRNCLFTFNALLALPVLASQITSATCDSFMKEGFLRGNEKGTFFFTADPLKISVLVGGEEIIINDPKNRCTLPIDTQFSSKYFLSTTGWSNFYFYSQSSSVTHYDGGALALRNSAGGFTCRFLESTIKLSNCVIK
ncbi:MAG TPA: hypothetical protein VNJ01_10850 [Bacteriovoracaceae bacterium]|nr:hypothetical protein [Bacteriovoracaceae bacterium]